MTSRLRALAVAAQDPPRLARFWAAVLHRQVDPGGAALLPDDDSGFVIRFLFTPEGKSEPGQMHWDLTSSSPQDQDLTVRRALGLGAQHLDVGQLPDEGHVVLSDPEGYEFCVVGPGNGFLAGCGRLGALSCDGSREVGHFWSRALGWPLVWDQDQETAIQSPHGGTKISWGGPPVRPKTARHRMHLELEVPVGGGSEEEADRLVRLGAAPAPGEPCGAGGLQLLDPDGNEFCLTPRAGIAR